MGVRQPLYGNLHATLCCKIVCPLTLTYHQLEAALLDSRGHPVSGPCHTASALYSMVRTHTDAVYREFQAAMGGANPAARPAASPVAHTLGNYRGTGEIVPFCTCISLMAKWTYAFGAHLGLSHAFLCLDSYFFHPN